MTSTTPSKPKVTPPGREPWLQGWKEPIVVVTFLALIATVVVAAFQILKGDIVASKTRLGKQIETVDVKLSQQIEAVDLRQSMPGSRKTSKISELK